MTTTLYEEGPPTLSQRETAVRRIGPMRVAMSLSLKELYEIDLENLLGETELVLNTGQRLTLQQLSAALGGETRKWSVKHGILSSTTT